MRELVPIIIIVVIIVGFWVGRWYAEVRRAMYDRKKNWYSRQDYRRNSPEKPDHLWW